MPRLRAVLSHSRTILQARWNPVRAGCLALCCGTRALYTWSDEWVSLDSGPGMDDGNEKVVGEDEEMAECIGIPASMQGSLILFTHPD